MVAAAAMLIFVLSVALDRRAISRKYLFLNRSCRECHWHTSTTLKRWGSKLMPMTLKTGLGQSERPGNSGSSDDANSAGGRSGRVALASGPCHHWLITRSWSVVWLPPRVRSRDTRGVRAKSRCNRIPYAVRSCLHGGRQRSMASPFRDASTRLGATWHTSTPTSSGI